MAQRQDFQSLPREKQRLNLLRRLNAVRREIEQQMIDMQYWNDLQRSRGRATIPEDPKMVRSLAEIDQQIKQVRELR
jgi:hypothetical protein